MSREIYKRVAPHLQRVQYDAGETTREMNNLFLLHCRQESLKDNTRLLINPMLYGYKQRQNSGYNYATKAYSANSINRELGSENLVLNGGFDGSSNWSVQAGWSIADGFANCNGVGTGILIYQSAFVPNSLKTYKGYVTISNYLSGQLRIWTGVAYINLPQSNGAHLIDIPLGWTYSAGFNFSSNYFVGSIDNISIREVLATDLAQTAEANQPYIDKIAPTEPLGLKNANGDVRYMTHAPVSFAANEEWTVESVLNWNGHSAASYLCKGGTYSYILLRGSGNTIVVTNESNTSVGSTVSLMQYVGKTISLSFIAAGNGTVKVYVNGVFVQSITIASNITFSTLFNSLSAFYGTLYHYSIYNKALSASDILEGATLLRSIFPEIPSVQIGTQTWAVRNLDVVSTPQGNAIQEMQAAANVERIVNGTFEGTFTNGLAQGWLNNGATATQETGRLGGSAQGIARNTNDQVYQVPSTTTGKYIRISFWYKTISGTGAYLIYSGTTNLPEVADWTQIVLYKVASAGTGLDFHSGGSGSKIIIDDVSFQEVGFSDSTNLYTVIYNQTSGTPEQKTYAALKAAAMWSHPSNDLALGSVYGKGYNGFAAVLLAMDIAYYNAANPSTPWGYDVPLEADINTLIATVGASNALKLMAKGSSYWNTGTGTDDFGFSLLGAGNRADDGSFSTFPTKAYGSLHTATRSGTSQNIVLSITDNGSNLVVLETTNMTRGRSIRLIKR